MSFFYSLEESQLTDHGAEIWKKQLDVNFYGVTNLVSAILPHFRDRRSGTIAFMNSVCAYAMSPGCGPYSVSKQAVNGMTDLTRTRCFQIDFHQLIQRHY